MLLVALAHAHQAGLSYVQVGREEVAVVVAKEEVKDRLPVVDLDAARLLWREATLDKLWVSAAGAPCELGEAGVTAVEGDGVEVRAPLRCPAGAPWTVEAAYLADMNPGHRAYLEVLGQPRAVLDAASPRADFDGVPHPGEVALAFLREGVGHILLGYDHLVFLFGLLLTAGRLRDMLLVITGFTLAHSLTLSLAATGVFTLPPAVVEPAIAASIAFVGIENFFRPPARRRVWVTFFLGLIHGFGFAGALAELGLPRDMLGVALLCFNAGVELGQAGLVLLALPVLLGLRRAPIWERRGVPAFSAAVAAMGLWWLVERLAG